MSLDLQTGFTIACPPIAFAGDEDVDELDKELDKDEDELGLDDDEKLDDPDEEEL